MSRNTKKPEVKIDKAMVAHAVTTDVLGKTKPVTMEEKARAQLDKLRLERDAMINQANQQISAISGAITALEILLAPPVKEQSKADAPKAPAPTEAAQTPPAPREPVA